MIASRIATGEISYGSAGGVEGISPVPIGILVDGFLCAPLQQHRLSVRRTRNETADFVVKKYKFSR